VSFDNVDGDGGSGYAHNGTLSWAASWTTPYTATSTVNAPVNPAAFYQVQTSGNLCEIKDSIFYNNNAGAAYTEANARSVFNAANNNVLNPAMSPIRGITRGAPVNTSGVLVMQPVTSLDPRPANAALTSVNVAPNDGFFTPVRYRGAFAPEENWLCGWTAASAFGFSTVGANPHVLFSQANPGANVVAQNRCLTPGGETWNLVGVNAIDPSGLGNGPILGFPASSLLDIVGQLTAPIGTPVLHFLAPSANPAQGSYALPAGISVQTRTIQRIGTAVVLGDMISYEVQ
jgi:hypothetical protein